MYGPQSSIQTATGESKIAISESKMTTTGGGGFRVLESDGSGSEELFDAKDV